MKKYSIMTRLFSICLCAVLIFGFSFFINGTGGTGSALAFTVNAPSNGSGSGDTKADDSGSSSSGDTSGSAQDTDTKTSNNHKRPSGGTGNMARPGTGSNQENPSASSADNKSAVIDTYSDQNMEITITKAVGEDLAYFVADIKLSSPDYLKTAFAFGQYGGSYRQYTSAMAESNDAVLAINGDYYNYRNDGIIIRNGKLYRDKASDRQMLIIDENGDFSFAWEADADAQELISQNALDTFSFGPALVIDGAIQEIPSSYFIKTGTTEPRCAIGQIGTLHYVFVVVDGRDEGYSTGVTVSELAEIMQNLGCTGAYNLDGGGSATLVFQDEVINSPSNGGDGGERSISDIIYIG